MENEVTLTEGELHASILRVISMAEQIRDDSHIENIEESWKQWLGRRVLQRWVDVGRAPAHLLGIDTTGI
jgi:hypothetical protein